MKLRRRVCASPRRASMPRRCPMRMFRELAAERARSFREEAPMTAAAAARVILDGVKAGRWRILVGDDANRLDERVRQTPERAYDTEFYQSFAAEVGWRLG